MQAGGGAEGEEEREGGRKGRGENGETGGDRYQDILRTLRQHFVFKTILVILAAISDKFLKISLA